MKDELKRKWIEALESGEFLQGEGGFRINGCYCCLGVLCEVSGNPLVEHKVEPDEGRDGYSYFVPEGLAVSTDNSSAGALTFEPEALAELGMSRDVQHKLYNMNDGTSADGKKYTFAEIAEWIKGHDLETGEELV